MTEDMTFEEIMEERRQRWGAPAPTHSNAYTPLSAASASETFDPLSDQVMEDTVPLSRYRPDRLY